MIEMMRLLHDEIRTPGFATAAMIESISEFLRIKLSRLTRTSGDAVPEPSAFGKSDIALIHDYIEAQSGRSPSVTELATLKAKRLLAESDRLIKQVASETGFKSPSNFALAFERT